MIKIRTHLLMLLLAVGLLAGACRSQKIPCPDVSGNKKFSLKGLFKRQEPTAADQANEGRDYGGQRLGYDKNGLVKKKKVRLPTQKKGGGTLLQKLKIK